MSVFSPQTRRLWAVDCSREALASPLSRAVVCPVMSLTTSRSPGSGKPPQSAHASLPRAPRALIALIVLAGGLLVGCGKALPRATAERGSGPVAAVGAHGAGGLSTKNTTRLGGSESSIDAAAVALAVYPALSNASRPGAVLLVDGGNWPAALATSVLSGAPLHAPLLYSNAGGLPAVSSRALGLLKPTGIARLAGAQVIQVGGARSLSAYRTHLVAGGSSAELAVEIERLSGTLRGHRARQVILTAAGAPPAMTMPVAGLSAQTGAPILFVERSAIPPATSTELARIKPTSIYLVGPSKLVSETVARELERFGSVTRIAGSTPTSNAIALARFTDGSFGWGVEEPGHGLVFVNASRPLDAPAAAPLSASGDYGPLLLVENSRRLPSELIGYLSDLQPGSPPSGPVHGVYNHGWVIGDESAISSATQARLDGLLEISPRAASEPVSAPQSTSTSEQTPSTGP
jgi:ell wall binding domain 2 (CWB2)